MLHPDISWSPKRSPKILNSSAIHANKIMNQKMDPTTLQKSMSHSFMYAVRTARGGAATGGATVPRSLLIGITRVGRGWIGCVSGGAGAAWVVVLWVVVLCPTPVSVHSHGRLASAPVATDPEARRGGAGDRIASIAADRPRIAEALGHFAWGTRQYLLVTTVFGLIVAVLDTIALAILGIPLAITWGLLSFITNYIPNIGFILGVIPPALLGLLTGGPKLMVIVIVVYCVLNTVIQSVIQPRFIGDAVGLSVTVN